MSLKAIHIVFISASILLAIGFAAWCFENYVSGAGSNFDLVFGAGSAAAAIALICYGRYFLKKLKNVSYL